MNPPEHTAIAREAASEAVRRLAEDRGGLRKIALAEEILLDVNDMKALLGVSRPTIVKLCERQDIPAFWFEAAGGWRITLPAFRDAVQKLERRGRSKTVLGERRRKLDEIQKKRLQ